MREIKFRAWDSDPLLEEPEMYDWKKLDKLDTEGLIHLYDILSGKEKHIIPMQYTGLKDRNGKEIYEGDIVTDGANNGIVFYNTDSGQYQVDFLPYEDCPQEMQNQNNWAMVIGNIHENPELINQNQTP